MKRGAQVRVTKQALAEILFRGTGIQVLGVMQTPADILEGVYTFVLTGPELPEIPDGAEPLRVRFETTVILG